VPSQKIHREQLAREYEELAVAWEELAHDIADEKWLPVENEALLHFENSFDSLDNDWRNE
jgi:hypothetical protein